MYSHALFLENILGLISIQNKRAKKGKTGNPGNGKSKGSINCRKSGLEVTVFKVKSTGRHPVEF